MQRTSRATSLFVEGLAGSPRCALLGALDATPSTARQRSRAFWRPECQNVKRFAPLASRGVTTSPRTMRGQTACTTSAPGLAGRERDLTARRHRGRLGVRTIPAQRDRSEEATSVPVSGAGIPAADERAAVARARGRGWRTRAGGACPAGPAAPPGSRDQTADRRSPRCSSRQHASRKDAQRPTPRPWSANHVARRRTAPAAIGRPCAGGTPRGARSQGLRHGGDRCRRAKPPGVWRATGAPTPPRSPGTLAGVSTDAPGVRDGGGARRGLRDVDIGDRRPEGPNERHRGALAGRPPPVANIEDGMCA